MLNVQAEYISKNFLYRKKMYIISIIYNFIILNNKLYLNKKVLYVKIFQIINDFDFITFIILIEHYSFPGKKYI